MADDVTESIREALRDLVRANPQGVDGALLREFGWPELLADDARTAISVLFDEVGRSAAVVAGVDVLAEWVASTTEPAAEGCRVFVIDSDFDQSAPIRGFALGPRSTSSSILMVDLSARSAGLAVGEAASLADAAGIDPAGQAQVATLPRSGDVTALSPEVASQLVDEIRRAVAYEQVGLATAMLEIACEHVATRVQFGRPIGVNQTVQHRLADLHVALQAASAALDATWDDSGATSVAVAYALAAAAAEVGIRNSLQVCGGMGLTEEFALAPLVRRSLSLSGVFESRRAVEGEIAATILKAGRVPRLSGFHGEAA